MNLGLNMFCAPSAGSVARINALPALLVGSSDGCVPTKYEHRSRSFIKITAGETSVCQKGKGGLGQETHFVFSGHIRFY